MGVTHFSTHALLEQDHQWVGLARCQIHFKIHQLWVVFDDQNLLQNGAWVSENLFQDKFLNQDLGILTPIVKEKYNRKKSQNEPDLSIYQTQSISSLESSSGSLLDTPPSGKQKYALLTFDFHV